MVAITVSDPRVENPNTRSSFATYLVSTKQGNAVRRRYSDFRWLYQRLQTEVPGAIVPVIPHTRTILLSSRKFDPDFMDSRRRDLQEFVDAVSDHPELCRAPSMTPFMLLELGASYDDGKKKMEQKTPTCTDVTKWADETAKQADAARKGISKLFSKIRISTGSQDLLTTQDEREIQTLYAYITESHTQVKHLARVSDSLLKSTLAAEEAYHEFGVPVGLWKTTYTELNGPQDQTALDIMSGICKLSDEMSSVLLKKYKEEDFLFGHHIHKLANTVWAFEMALRQRKKTQVDYTHYQNVLVEKGAALEKAQKAYKPPEVTEKLLNERRDLEAKLELKRTKFEEVTKRVLRDAEKFKPRLVDMLKESFLMLAKTQLSYNARINEANQRLLPVLEGGNSNTALVEVPSSPNGPNGHPMPSAPPPSLADEDNN